MSTEGEHAAAEAGGKHARAGGRNEQEEEAPPTAEPAAKKTRRESEAQGEEGADEEEGAPAEGGGEAAAAGAGSEERGSDGAAAKEGIIEQGRIQFFYRPKVEREEVASLADVQRFFMLLRPQASGQKSRLCVLGKKRLPSARRHERFFGFVESVSDDADELLAGLGPQEYQTKTRGTRHVGACRALGQGTYAVVEHRDHTNLVYKLEVPSTPGKAQLEFTIGLEGSFIFSVKNPAGRGPGDPGLDRKAEYPSEKQAEFEHCSWIPVRDTQLLEFERCEFLLVGARQDEDVTAELGAKEEQLAEASRRGVEAACGPESDEECLVEAMREELKAERHGISTEPAETGELA